MFDEMINGICEDTARGVLSFVPRNKEDIKRKSVAKITNTGFVGGGDGTEKKQPIKKGVKVGRNDLCPCGSGKKYKKCCGLNENAE
jgi:preprotein translocase subunit SecA